MNNTPNGNTSAGASNKAGQDNANRGGGKPARTLHRRRRMGDAPGGAASSTWLVTFTDIMALMLTFFVLLYSMSNPEDHKWSELTQNLKKELNKFYGPRAQKGAKDVVNIKRLEQDQALSLSYLEPLIRKQFKKEDGLKNVVIFRNAGRLVLALPQTLVFQTGGRRLSEQGRQALFTIANVLSRIQNAIEIVGHADPRPIADDAQMPYSNNWALSLGRAAEVASVLKKEGFRGELKLKGVAEARYTELPDNLSQRKRQQLARRVDIVIETFE
jgi:chemotaxis protein MotB